MGDYIRDGTTIGVMKGKTRSLDYSSYRLQSSKTSIQGGRGTVSWVLLSERAEPGLQILHRYVFL